MVSKRNEERAASAARVGRMLPGSPGGWVPTEALLAGDDTDTDADDTDAVDEPEEPEPAQAGEPQGLPPPSLREALRAAVLDRVPPTLRGGRVGPGRRGWHALLAVALLAVAVSGVLWWRSRSVPSALPPVAVHSAATAGATGSAGTPTPHLIVVDVVGRVRHPGIVRLPDGSRVYDAIRAAGGLKPHADTRGLNLARKLVDGEQVVVGAPAVSSGASPPAGVPSSAAPSAKVDLNTATLEQLDELPGVGPVLAQRILDYRTKIGRFTSVSQLDDVSGIGPARYADIEPLVTV